MPMILPMVSSLVNCFMVLVKGVKKNKTDGTVMEYNFPQNCTNYISRPFSNFKSFHVHKRKFQQLEATFYTDFNRL